jgi:hypothetical protein
MLLERKEKEKTPEWAVGGGYGMCNGAIMSNGYCAATLWKGVVQHGESVWESIYNGVNSR